MSLTKTESLPLISRYCRFSVRLMLVMIGINLFIAMVLQGRGLPDGTIRMMILTAILGIAWIVSNKGWRLTANFLFVAGIYLAFFVYPIAPFFTSKPAEDLFLCIFLLLVSNAVIPVIFEARERKMIIGWMIVLYLTFYYVFNYTLEQLDPVRYGSLRALFDNQPVLIYGIVGSSIFVSAIITQFKIRNEQSKAFLERRTVELTAQEDRIKNQNHALDQAKSELELLQKELRHTYSSLEDRVMKRMNELEVINQRIVNHGFIHSEEIKECFKRLKDTTSFTNGKATDQLKKEIVCSIAELDKAILSINKNLAVAEFDLK